MSSLLPCVQAPGLCPCCRLRAERRARRKPPAVADRWTPEHDAILRAGAARGETLEQMADRLDRDHKIRRTADAIRDRLSVLGESLRQGWRSQNEVATLLDVHPTAIGRWRAQGLLSADRHGGSHWLRILDADLEAFVRAHAGTLVDPSRIRDARLRSLAEVSARANRTIKAVAGAVVPERATSVTAGSASGWEATHSSAGHGPSMV